MGENYLAASHIVKSIYFILFIPILGFAVSANTIISNMMGGGAKKSEMILTIKKIIFIGFSSFVLIAPWIYMFKKKLIIFYTSEPILIDIILPIVKIVLISTFFQCIGFILHNSVSGTGNTKAAMIIELITILIYLFLSYMCVFVWQLSLKTVWGMEIVYFVVMGIFSFLYLRFFSWERRAL